jgi:hypothetical protein
VEDFNGVGESEPSPYFYQVVIRLVTFLNLSLYKILDDRLCGLVVSVEDYKHRGPGHSLGFF